MVSDKELKKVFTINYPNTLDLLIESNEPIGFKTKLMLYLSKVLIPLNLENVTDNFDLTNVIQSAVYSYCRMYVPPTKCSNGVYLYRAATNMDSIPFEAAVFENYTEKDYKVKLNIVGKGEKSFCFYAIQFI